MFKKEKHHRHVDDSEVWKQKSLLSAKRRKEFARYMYIIMWIAVILVVGACVWAYFFDR